MVMSVIGCRKHPREIYCPLRERSLSCPLVAATVFLRRRRQRWVLGRLKQLHHQMLPATESGNLHTFNSPIRALLNK